MIRRIYRPSEVDGSKVAPQSPDHSDTTCQDQTASSPEARRTQAIAESESTGAPTGGYYCDCGAGPFATSQKLAAHVRWEHKARRQDGLLDRLNNLLRLRGD